MSNKIPIKNIFYLLSYAYDFVEENDSQYVNLNEAYSVLDLLGQIITNATSKL